MIVFDGVWRRNSQIMGLIVINIRGPTNPTFFFQIFKKKLKFPNPASFNE
jgi:hypothetical protein